MGFLMRLRNRNIMQTMKVAVEGCCHGELDKIYDHIASLERKHNYKVDLLLVCGDFQAVRNHADLQCMAVPQKYRQLGGFHKYYLGITRAPLLTIVIGGNHEASNYMWELYHGGWLAPNIYFLGFSGCVQVNGIRIAGLSGIYKPNHYNLGYYEKVPYNDSSIRSIYHVRQYDVFKLAQLSPPDIFLSHDWPNTIEKHGDLQSLLRRKPFFRQETQAGTLGSPPLFDLLKKIKPQRWFSAHLHTKFEAVYKHDCEGSGSKIAENPDEIVIDDEDLEVDGQSKPAVQNPDEINIDRDDDSDGALAEPLIAAPHSATARSVHDTRPTPRETRFLALDKCLPKRDFLEVVDVPLPSSISDPQPPRLTFDPEWLAVSRALHPFLCTTRTQVALPKPDDARALVATELEWVHGNVLDSTGLKDISEVQKFWRTAPGPTGTEKGRKSQPCWYTNPQTEAFTRLLQIPNKVNPVPPGKGPLVAQGSEPGIPEDTRTSIGDATQEDDGEISLPVWDSGVDGGNSAGEGSAGDAPPSTDLTYQHPSGGWSPSRES